MALVQINRDPTPSQLRWFTLIWFPAAVLMIALMLHFKLGLTTAGVTIFALSLALIPIGLARPAIMRTIWIGWMIAVFPIGFVISHTVIFLLWYGVITPVGFALWLTGYDGMQRRLDRSAKTYWEPHVPHGARSRYFRQF